jgi:SAM-dependent MidA family methyltransferase
MSQLVAQPHPLAANLARRIRAEGPLRLSQYMQACLHDPEHGYYRTRADTIGRSGDFVTAPEISQIFGELIGLWAVATWEAMGSPIEVDIIELGPGRGALMADALRAMRVAPAMLSAACVMLVEESGPLQATQRSALAGAPVRIEWGALEQLGASGRPSIVLANEFLDAMPVDQLVRRGAGWAERRVGLTGDGRLGLVEIAFDGAFGGSVPEGSVVERQDWSAVTAALARISQRAPVSALFIDYGYQGPALGDTLQAVRGHRYEPILASPGEADLSCHVDFTAFARSAQDMSGGRLLADGPVSQGEFLGRLGAVERASRLMAMNPAHAASIEQGVARLLSPTGMGGQFLALGLRSPDLPTTAGM